MRKLHALCFLACYSGYLRGVVEFNDVNDTWRSLRNIVLYVIESSFGIGVSKDRRVDWYLRFQRMKRRNKKFDLAQN